MTIWNGDEILYWAITGRICGDDEDTLLVYGPCTWDEANSSFRHDMRLEAGLPTLDGEPDSDEVLNSEPEGVAVFFTSACCSTSPIHQR